MIASFDPFGSKEKSITGSIIQHRRDSVIKCSNYEKLHNNLQGFQITDSQNCAMCSAERFTQH